MASNALTTVKKSHKDAMWRFRQALPKDMVRPLLVVASADERTLELHVKGRPGSDVMAQSNRLLTCTGNFGGQPDAPAVTSAELLWAYRSLVLRIVKRTYHRTGSGARKVHDMAEVSFCVNRSIFPVIQPQDHPQRAPTLWPQRIEDEEVIVRDFGPADMVEAFQECDRCVCYGDVAPIELNGLAWNHKLYQLRQAAPAA